MAKAADTERDCGIRISITIKWGNNGSTAMLLLMKEFVVDPTCCTMTYTEKHVVESVQYQTTEYVWLTKVELYILYKAYAFEDGTTYADKIIAAAKKPT